VPNQTRCYNYPNLELDPKGLILNTHPTMMGLGFLHAHPTTHIKTLYMQSDNVKITQA
jgi:hypothetical protein